MCLECGCGEHTALTCPECGGRVILINEKAKCLSCGASPPVEEASPRDAGHHHHHHHDADHEHAHDHHQHAAKNAVERGELVEKLQVLLPHWIEHNAEHAESFRTWADRARDAGDPHVAAHIEAAAKKIADANRDLEGLIEHIGEPARDHDHLGHDHPH